VCLCGGQSSVRDTAEISFSLSSFNSVHSNSMWSVVWSLCLQGQFGESISLNLCRYVYVCMYVCMYDMYVCVYYVCLFVCTYVRTFVYIYVCLYMCMYDLRTHTVCMYHIRIHKYIFFNTDNGPTPNKPSTKVHCQRQEY
jgi:hypothetical protein